MMDGPILVTGVAGFIGFHVARRLLASGRAVVGLDNLNSYYDPSLKQARLAELGKAGLSDFAELDLANRAGIAALFAKHRFPAVIHLAAQAGFAIHWSIRSLISIPISSASRRSSKAVVTTAVAIWSMRRRRRFTAATRRCHSRCIRMSIIR